MSYSKQRETIEADICSQMYCKELEREKEDFGVDKCCTRYFYTAEMRVHDSQRASHTKTGEKKQKQYFSMPQICPSFCAPFGHLVELEMLLKRAVLSYQDVYNAFPLNILINLGYIWTHLTLSIMEYIFSFKVHSFLETLITS